MSGRTTRYRSTAQYSFGQALALAAGVPLAVLTAVVALSYPAIGVVVSAGVVAVLGGRRVARRRSGHAGETTPTADTTEDATGSPLGSADRRSS
ncbi:hypothetical protein GJ629_09990 [Halapricum sp. CBA1109]|uniref:hypothetical protein n=1 Tax=Halapricum sp. CBA1109 TaxID=2668068 RepID=UPI0012F7E3F4|nr:hypothetical protein [Halapricum sp. CBA1109]MUV90177.1 hypothetical protein [Halapricum sp. CBA1109]